MKQLPIIQQDPYLEPYRQVIQSRQERTNHVRKQLLKEQKTLSEFACGHLFFGLHRLKDSWVFREWAPNAKEIYLVGDFSKWQKKPAYRLLNRGNYWEVEIPKNKLKHGDHYHLQISWDGGEGARLPAWCRRTVQDETTKVFTAQVWHPSQSYQWQCNDFAGLNEPPIIYEAHIGMATEEGKVGSYKEFRENVLPSIVAGGYNTIQLMAIQEHPYYGSFGYHVSNFFSPSFRFGTPEELKALVDEIHAQGLAVIMDIVHSHAVKNENEGLSCFDGTTYQYFHEGDRGNHVAWDSRCFNYGKPEVIHFLLSNCKYWLEEYRFDGFRFDGVTSMLYYDHGLGRDFTSYQQYFDNGQDEDAITYLTLANELIHEVKSKAISVAEEMSGMPGLASTISDGGMGFDFRLAMGGPDYWIKLIKEKSDEDWHVGDIFYELSRKRVDEKTINYAESHDQALVGDKTIIFRLIDSDMYWDMHVDHQNMNVDRGIALHKMIRIITISLAGGGYLNFMGNEFGHPEWIDFPREGNDWSYHYARRQWSLAKDKNLKYKYLLAFDEKMIELIKKERVLEDPHPYKHWDQTGDQVLAYSRGGLLFIYNFHPSQSFTDYMFAVPEGEYRVVLNSDSPEMGGFDRIDEKASYFSMKHGYNTENKISLYIPNRTVMVLKHIGKDKR